LKILIDEEVLQNNKQVEKATALKDGLKTFYHLSLRMPNSATIKKISVLFFVMILFACNRNLSPEELRAKLKFTMTDFLYKNVNYDSSKVKYHVEDVIYYIDKDYYDCEFKVFMSVKGGEDTLGGMRAKISKDFTKVLRNY
jgi:hypothetical protein